MTGIWFLRIHAITYCENVDIFILTGVSLFYMWYIDVFGYFIVNQYPNKDS